jgi:hypothetical protein
MTGLAMSPYFMGQLFDVYKASGIDRGESLQTAIASGLLVFVVTFVFLPLAWRHLSKDESTRLARAREQGEEVNSDYFPPFNEGDSLDSLKS